MLTLPDCGNDDNDANSEWNVDDSYRSDEYDHYYKYNEIRSEPTSTDQKAKLLWTLATTSQLAPW